LFSVPSKYDKITTQHDKECSSQCVQSVSGITLWTTVWARISILTLLWMGKEEMVLWFYEAKPFTKTAKALICVN